MKDKNVAGILALLFGWMGIHRFYLGQTGRGLFYAIFSWIAITSGSFGILAIPWIFALIESMVLFSMDKEEFDIKYNKRYYKTIRKKKKNQPARQQDVYEEPVKKRPQDQKRPQRQTYTTRNPFKDSGIKKFRDFDYQGAIVDFEKALENNPRDIALHFNLACAYSLNENVKKSFYHLDQAVDLGFNDFDRIKTHDALAFIRVHPDFTSFESNGYQLARSAKDENLFSKEETPKSEEIEDTDDLLEQLKRLSELREKGLLSLEEFEQEKQKILRRGGK